MIDHISHYLLWKTLMQSQNANRCTETTLLQFAKYWWYDGYEGFNTDC